MIWEKKEVWWVFQFSSQWNFKALAHMTESKIMLDTYTWKGSVNEETNKWMIEGEGRVNEKVNERIKLNGRMNKYINE